MSSDIKDRIVSIRDMTDAQVDAELLAFLSARISDWSQVGRALSPHSWLGSKPPFSRREKANNALRAWFLKKHPRTELQAFCDCEEFVCNVFLANGEERTERADTLMSAEARGVLAGLRAMAGVGA